MSANVKKLLEAARTLSPTDRASLVEDLLSSLDEPDPQIDELWRREAEDRLAAYKRGDIEIRDADRVLDKKT